MKQNNKAVEKGIEYQNKIKEIILNTIIKKYNLSPQERAERVYADINYYIRKIEQITAEERTKEILLKFFDEKGRDLTLGNATNIMIEYGLKDDIPKKYLGD